MEETKVVDAAASDWNGAGLMPICLHPLRNEPCVLMYERFTGGKTGFIVDCGGAKETSDESSLQCAVREFSEETFGIFADDTAAGVDSERIATSLEYLTNDMARKKQHLTLEVSNPPHTYHIIITPIHFASLKALNRRMDGSDGGKRKEFTWVPLKDIIEEKDQLWVVRDSNKVPLHPRICHKKLLPSLSTVAESL